jgi:hypothetical protein
MPARNPETVTNYFLHFIRPARKPVDGRNGVIYLLTWSSGHIEQIFETHLHAEQWCELQTRRGRPTKLKDNASGSSQRRLAKAAKREQKQQQASQ